MYRRANCGSLRPVLGSAERTVADRGSTTTLADSDSARASKRAMHVPGRGSRLVTVGMPRYTEAKAPTIARLSTARGELSAAAGERAGVRHAVEQFAEH